ncbi:hypothetical protein ACO2Q3_25890 [Caulobacter sp. KR2-114]|uniref:hypothetical protein n=1 Tax=Caulobacter sp. KR2-114 TaxID=3400912 RepID=UPI003BFC768E
MRRIAATALGLGLALAPMLAACSKGGGASGGGIALGGGDKLPADALDAAIGRSIGDPTTCVLIARASDRKVVYRYGEGFNCVRGLPACDRPGTLSAEQALALATPTGRFKSCNSDDAGDRSVGWAEGVAKSAHGRQLVYSAMMEGQRALPGMEMSARLDEAFANADL